MSLNYVNLTCDLFDGGSNFISQGVAAFTPTVTLVDGADNQFIPPAPILATFKPGASPIVKLLATDNAAALPNGWGWTVTFVNVPGNPAPFTFFLPFTGGSAQNLSDQAPVFTAVTMQLYLPLSGGLMTGPIAMGSHKITGLTNGSAAADALAFGQVPTLMAATSVAGYTLINGTGTILSWAVPNDGALHRLTCIAGLHVTSGETGGAITLNTTLPDGTSANPTAFGGGSGTGGFGFSTDRLVQAGSTVTLTQSSALTVGAAVLWAQLWGL